MSTVDSANKSRVGEVLLRVEDLIVEYKGSRSGVVQAVAGVSFEIKSGETVSVVGESGCGKSSLAKGVMQLVETKSGKVVLDGTEFSSLKGEELRQARPKMQMIFQDSVASLDPHLTVRALVEQPMKVWHKGTDAERRAKVNELLRSVNLDPEIVGNRKPTEFSGGQCQRVSIARALSLEPKLLVCDEPVSSLDVSIQSQILNIIQNMKKRYGLSLLFISHDLSVVRAISDRVIVMYLGKICEVSTPQKIVSSPAHHYTRALVASVPVPDPKVGRRPAVIEGEPPSPANPPSGCRFRTRCAAATALCAEQEPQLREVTPGQFVACHHPIA